MQGGDLRQRRLLFTFMEWERHLNLGNCFALAVWLASVGLLLFRAVRSRRKLAVKGKRREQGREPRINAD